MFGSLFGPARRMVTRGSMAAALAGILLPTGIARAEKLVVGHQMLPMPRYGGHTSVAQMREEVRQWKDMGLDAVMLFDIGGLTGGGPQLAVNGLKYHEAGVAEGFKFAMSMTYFPKEEIERYANYVKNLSDPKYAAARLFVEGRPYLSAYHASQHLPAVAASLASQGYPVYLEPMVFPRNFFGDYKTQAWESGYITSATPETWNILYSHPTWKDAQGLAAFEIAKSIGDQASQIDWMWNAAKANGKTARGSIVAYYKGFAHKGNWMTYEGWGFTRLRDTLRRAIDSGIPAIEFITLNDFAESSYFNSWAEDDPPIIVNHWNAFDVPAILDHSGFRYFSKRYIQWYKTGQEPAITEDELYYSYRLHPRDAADYHALPQATKDALQKWIAPGQPAEWLYRKGALPESYKGWGPNYQSAIDWGKFSDGIHVAVRLKSPADVYINGVKVGDNLPAGEHLLVKPGEKSFGDSGLGYPLHTFGPSDFGYPRFEIRRNGKTILDHTGELEITPYPVPGAWNVLARKAPAPQDDGPAAVTVSLTKPASGGSVEIGASVALAASTTGDVVKVEFYAGSAKIAEKSAAPWTAAWTPATTGSHTIKARAIDSSGNGRDSSPVSFTVTPAPVPIVRSPYGDERPSIPGRIEFERYDVGGEGVAYHDDTSANYGGSFRSDGVDIESNPTGHHVAFFSSGEWMLYSIKADTTARYRAVTRVASNGPGGAFRVELDGVDISGALAIPNTNGWSNWQTISFEAQITAGLHDLKIFGLANGQASSFIGNIDWIEFEPVVAPAPVPEPPTPAIASPANGAVLAAGTPVAITATLAGDTTHVTALEFFAGGVVIAKKTAAPWSHTWAEPPAGTHALTARVTISNGKTATSESVSLTVLPPAQSARLPYQGKRAAIPGIVEAENYDEGGAEVAYHDRTPENILGAYRSDAVDIEAHPEGHNIGWFQAGEWLLYSINATKSGAYDVTARVSSNGPGGAFRIELDGVDISGRIQIPDTGGWVEWRTISFEADIAAGNHDLRILGLENNVDHSWGTIANVDWIRFEKKTAPPPASPAPTPEILSPASGTIFAANMPVTITVGHAQTTGEPITVDVFIDDTLLASSHASRFSTTWKPGESGDYFISARATTASGGVAWSALTDISIQEPVTPPDLVSGSTVNVRDFGATPDDAGDDTLAIQAAIDAIGPLGGTVYLPAGVYVISPQAAGGDALTIAYDDLAIVGAGPDKTILSFHCFGGGDPAASWETIGGIVHRGRAVVIEGSADPRAPRSNISISSLRVTGNAPATGSLESPANPATGDGLDPSHVAIALASTFQLSGVLLENLELDDFRGGMIEANGAGFGLVEIVDNRIHGSNGVGVSISADARMIGNDIYDHALASVVATHLNQAAGQPQHGYYLDNIFEPRRALAQNGLDGFVLRGEGFASTGLRDEPLFLVVQGNTMQNSLRHGLLIDAQLHGAIIANNTFIDNGADGDRRHGHVTLAPARSGPASGVVEGVVIRGNSFAALASADSGHAVFLDTTQGAMRAIEVAKNTLINLESSGGAIERFLLLESGAPANGAEVVFAENIADEVALAAEDISTLPAIAMRPRYRDNTVNASAFVAGQNEFANTGATTVIHPSWSEARVTTDRADAVVTLAPYADAYPDQTALRLEANSGGHGFKLNPDATWLRLADPLVVAPGESIRLVKRAGRFDVVSSHASPGAPAAPANTPAKTPLAIVLSAPAGQASVPAGQSVAFLASVSGNSMPVASVEFLVDGALVHSSASAPYAFDWMPPRAGGYLAQARAIGANGSRVVSAPVVFTVSPPPLSNARSDGLQHGDIGAPAVAGSTSFDHANGSFAVTATGAGLRGTSDQFRFDHAEVAGDAELVARVARFTAGEPSAQAGLILRGSSHPGAAFVAVTVAPNGAVTLSHRAAHGHALNNAATANGSAPIWLKLARRGDTFTGSVSLEGTTWSEIGRVVVNLPFIAAGGLITASASATGTAAAGYENFTITGTPRAFIGEDIGGPATSGFTASDPETGTHVLIGAGSDIWGRRDRFHFAHHSIEGDATLMTRVEAIDAPHPGAKAGVMLRAGVATDAQHALLAVTPETGLILQWRGVSGDITQSVAWPGFHAPVSLALEREGGMAHAYVSTDGESWQLLKTIVIALPETCEAGMAVTSRTPSTTATARFVDTGVVH